MGATRSHACMPSMGIEYVCSGSRVSPAQCDWSGKPDCRAPGGWPGVSYGPLALLSPYLCTGHNSTNSGRLDAFRTPLSPCLPLPFLVTWLVSLPASSFLLFGLFPQPQPALSFLPPSDPCFLILLQTSPFTLVFWEQERVVTGSPPGSHTGGRKKQEGIRRPCWHHGVNQQEGGWACR